MKKALLYTTIGILCGLLYVFHVNFFFSAGILIQMPADAGDIDALVAIFVLLASGVAGTLFLIYRTYLRLMRYDAGTGHQQKVLVAAITTAILFASTAHALVNLQYYMDGNLDTQGGQNV